MLGFCDVCLKRAHEVVLDTHHLSRQDVDKKKPHMQINQYCKYSIYSKDWHRGGTKRDNCGARKIGVKKSRWTTDSPTPTARAGVE